MVASIENECRGGDSNLLALGCEKRSSVYSPKVAEVGMINKALKPLGVDVTAPSIDGFDAMALGQ